MENHRHHPRHKTKPENKTEHCGSYKCKHAKNKKMINFVEMLMGKKEGNVILNVCEFSFDLNYLAVRNIALSGSYISDYGWSAGISFIY
ncbi:MAG: hypothetical protein ABI261_08685 [Ginsengibacter sp.]